MSSKLVGIVMGSKSDAATLQATTKILDEFGVGYEQRILSAHRSPEAACAWAKDAENKGFQVLIAAAGMAAHLAGVVAAHTNLPVIGIPVGSGPLQGQDALLSTVQMPKGTPVATVAVGEAGAANAALLAIKILALADKELRKKFEDYRKRLAEDVLEADNALQQK